MSRLTVGENGETAFSSTGNKNLDLFGTVNRDVDIDTLIVKFVDAWNENPECAIKVLLNFRDIRGGKGEKLISKIMMLIVKITNPDAYGKLLPLFVDVGSWKDVLFLYEMGKYYDPISDTESDPEVSLFVNQLKLDEESDHPTLCAKWAPSEGCHFDRKTDMVKKIMKKMIFSPKDYRHLLTGIRGKINTVESQMSQDRTDEIDFSVVPSVALLRYRQAFSRDSNTKGIVSKPREDLKERYRIFMESLKNGEKKVNFKAVMPHELIKSMKSHCEVVQNQWNSMRDEIKNLSVFDNCVSIVDVSGSMQGSINAGSKDTTSPMDVAIALGILISECAKGEFSNKVFTFSEMPQLIDISCPTLYEKYEKVKSMEWGGSTDIEAVFNMILEIGLKNEIPRDKMPEKLFIFTDMQFNAIEGRHSEKSFDKLRTLFDEHGYKLPQIVCWNLRSVSTTSMEQNDENVCMLSGFSANVLKTFLTSGSFDPISIFLATIASYKVPDALIRPINIKKIDIEKIKNSVEKCKFTTKKVTDLSRTLEFSRETWKSFTPVLQRQYNEDNEDEDEEEDEDELIEPEESQTPDISMDIAKVVHEIIQEVVPKIEPEKTYVQSDTTKTSKNVLSSIMNYVFPTKQFKE